MMTNDQFYENLIKEFPELMEKSTFGYVEVGAGWFNIIRTLCKCLSNDIHHARNRLRAAQVYPRDDGGKYRDDCEAGVATALSELPSISTLKEKFGTLRVYVDGGNDMTYAYTSFAESMSACTCEVCGSPGKIDVGRGWLKTHCKEHFTPDAVDSFHTGKIEPNLFSD